MMQFRRRHTRVLAAAMGLAVSAAVTATVSGPVSAAPRYPVSYDAVTSFAAGTYLPNTPPPGANNWACRSTKHPRPVILLHGFMANQNNTWRAVAPALANQGYCVFSLTMGPIPKGGPMGNLESMHTSAKQVAALVNKVRHRTGVDKVDLIGHSAGGTVSSIYLKYHGGAANVFRTISLAGAMSGFPDVSGLANIEVPGMRAAILSVCPGCNDLSNRQTYVPLRTTMPTVKYVAITSTHDEFVTPIKNGLLPSAPNVTNLLVQSICPQSVVGHIGIVYDSSVVQIVLNHLDPAHPRPVRCQPGFPW